MTTPQLNLDMVGYHSVLQEDFVTLDLSPDGTGEHKWYPGLWWEGTDIPPAGSITCVASELVLIWKANQNPSSTDVSSMRSDFLFGSAFRYGYFETVMRWPMAPGIWPAFWLIPATVQAHRGEIDVMEAQGTQWNMIFCTWHEWYASTDRANNSPNNQVTLPSGFDTTKPHRYGLLWEPGKLTYFIDGEPVLTATPPAIMDEQDYFIVLTLDAGLNWTSGNFSGMNVPPTEFTLYVDSVQVWQHD